MNLAQVTDCFPSVLDWEDSYLKNGGQRILGVGNGVHVEIFLDDVIQRIALILDDVSKETLHCLNLVTADQSASLSFLQTASVFAKGAKTLIEINGKLVTVTGHRFALKRIEDYLPVFISSRDLMFTQLTIPWTVPGR